MKKFFKIILTFSLALIIGLCLTACDDDNIVEKLQNEFGAILEGGDFIEGSILKLDKIDLTNEVAKTIFQSLENFGVNIDDKNETYIYDISVEKDGKEVQPNGKVKLTIPMSIYENIIGYDVYHIDSEGIIEKIIALFEDGNIIFETDGFSIYVIVPITSESKESKVTSLELDAHNAGFAYNENDTLAEKTEVLIGSESTPKVEYVLVYGVTAEENIILTKDTDYTIDLGGLDFTKEGIYTITYTYKKDTNIKATLKVEVVAPKYAFSAVVGKGDGKIHYNSLEQPNGYYGEHKEGEQVTLKAVAGNNYEFEGWYNGENLISTSSEYTFTIGNEDARVLASFKAKVTSFELDAHNAGFAYNENNTLAEKTEVLIGSESTPKAEYVLVYGVTAEENIILTKDTDYTIDLGGLDFTKEGIYTITYTYKKDTNIKATLKVEVVAPKYAFSAVVGKGDGKIHYNSLEQPNGYFGEHKEGEQVTLKAVAGNNYEFEGWYNGENLISTSSEYTFTIGNEDARVLASFKAKVTSLELDAHNAGFAYNENDTLAEKTEVLIGSESTPKVEYVLVYGVTAEENIILTKDTDYTIDLGGLDFTKEGIYTITYTYKKDTNIKATLKVEVVAPKYAFSAVVGKGDGKIHYNSLEQPNGYYGEHKEGEQVTLKAVAGNNYEFEGWYNGENLISTSSEYTFTIGNEDARVLASFKAKVTALELDAHNAGFAYNENNTLAEKTEVLIGSESTPKAEYVLVYGVTAEENIILTKDTDYTIDLGGLDFTKEGIYTITYTYKKDTNIKATLKVEVVAPKYNFLAQASPYDGGKIIENNQEVDFGNGRLVKLGTSISLSVIVNDGYTFQGWYKTSTDGEVLISSDENYTFVVNDNTYVYAKFEEDNEDLTFTYNGSQSTSWDAIKYYGRALSVSPKYILVNETPLSEITNTAILDKITYKWLDRKTGLEVKTDDDITLDGTTYQFGRDNRTVGDEIAGPCIVGEYEFALYYDGIKQLSIYAAVKENTFKKITEVYDFSTTEGVGLLQSMNYYTIVGVVDGQLYVMQMPKDGSKVTGDVVEAEARLVTPDEDGIISLGNKLDFVFSNMRYYINEWVYYPSSSTSRENLLLDFTTGYYGARLEQAPDNSFDYYIYRKGYVSLSGGRITREKGSVDTSTYGHLTVFDDNGAVKIYEPRKGQTVNNALRLVKDGDKYVFTSIPADTDTRESYDIFIYKCYEEVNATYNFYGDLNKNYDGDAVSFNIYEKSVDVYTENYEDIYTLAKMETVRFRFTDIEGNLISVSYVDRDGTVNGPTDVGRYIMWIELKEKGEDGEEWNVKAKLHAFEIKDNTTN